MSVFGADFNNAFFSLDDFSVQAVFKVNGTGSGTSILVNFFEEGDDIITEGGYVEVKSPTAMCKSSDVTGADDDSIIIIDGTTYYVINSYPDGSGVTVLILSKVKIT